MHDHHMSTLSESRITTLRDEADRQRLAHSNRPAPDRPGFAPPRRWVRSSLDTLLVHAVPSWEAR